VVAGSQKDARAKVQNLFKGMTELKNFRIKKTSKAKLRAESESRGIFSTEMC